jgi:hypothetical protein
LAPERHRLEPGHPLRALHKAAGRRWLVFLAALAALIWLGLFAGAVRNPGGVKRQWAVVASRAMAAAGGILVIRLLLFSHEERIPVFYVKTGEVPAEALKAWIGRLRGREDLVVPVSDVMAFMAERRYVPGSGVGIILEAGSDGEARALASIAGDIQVTILIPGREYAFSLGGSGYNRFGDRPDVIRPLDITPVIGLGRMVNLNTRLYEGMFRGRYIWWPVAALLRASGASPRWR